MRAPYLSQTPPGRVNTLSKLCGNTLRVGHDALAKRCRTLVGRQGIEVLSRQKAQLVTHRCPPLPHQTQTPGHSVASPRGELNS